MKRTLAVTITAGTVVFGLTACGGISSPPPTAGTGNAPATTPSSGPSGGPYGGSGAGASSADDGGGAAGGTDRQSLASFAAQLPAIKICLTTAGISTADLPTAFPTASRPSGQPRSSFPTSDRPTDRPPGGFDGGVPAGGGRFGGLLAILASRKDQTALKACGILVPTFAGRAPGAPAQPRAVDRASGNELTLPRSG